MSTLVNPEALRRRVLLVPALIALVAALATLLAATAVLAQDGEALTLVEDLPVWKAVILGLVEGLTEYLPVSSTGHLLVTNEILGLGQTPESEQAIETYSICIQAGAIAAVLVLYRERVRQMVDGLLGRSDEGRQVLLAIIVAFVPTAIIGLFIVDWVREQLFGVPPIAAAWLVGGIGILALTRSGLMERGGLAIGELTIGRAALIGVAQAVAMWPGTSRSLITIVAGVLVGLSLAAAVEFSFLLGLVTLSAATLATAAEDGGQLIDLYGVATPAVGMVVAFVAAVASVRWMVTWLQNRSFDVFGWYRIVIGIVAFAALGLGWL
ncbi:MAG: undecaprenyl-diphosphate phosphatase [Actinomycetota bacterium]